MRILHLTIYKQWLYEILEGTKNEEYRFIKPYWIKRLRGKEYDVVHFRNGYSSNAPELYVECMGIEEEGDIFIIKLGKILDYYTRGKINS